MALKQHGVNIPDYESLASNDIRDVFLTELQKSLDQTILSIRNLADGGRVDFDTIERAYKEKVLQSALKAGLYDGDKVKLLSSRDLSRLGDKEPTLTEMLASLAILFHAQCLLSLRDINLSEAFGFFAIANQCLGMAQGRDKMEAINDENKGLIQQYAAQIRHAENRLMKEEAIQYYKGNHASFTSKDDAALQIAGKIVPAKFATVRNWLKGVKPG